MMRLVALLVPAVASVLFAGRATRPCPTPAASSRAAAAEHTPARMRTHAPTPAVESALDGRWLVTITEPDSTQLVVRLTIESSRDGQWEAYSRAGAVREMIGRGTALLGGALGKLPPHAALLRVESGTWEMRGDSILVRGTLGSQFFGEYALTGAVVGGTLRAEIHRSWAPNGGRGTVVGTRATDESPVRDYRALAQSLRRVAVENVYDPALAASDAWTSFFEELDKRFADARDDLDAVGAFYALAPKLGSSHWSFIRNPKIASTPPETFLQGDMSINPDTLVVLQFPAPDVAFLWVRKWERVGPAVDRAFARIDSAGVHTLILDIRGNGGGDATSIAPATHLLRDSMTVGVFLGPKWYATHRAPPTRTELASLPVLSSDSNGVDLIRRKREHGGVVGTVVPKAPYFGGTVYLLVNGGTGSASEPLAHLLKTTKRATLVGERTAGKMLTALPHDLGDGWILVVPESDYYAADGTRLEGRGVEPDIATKAAEAMIETAKRMSLASPYARSMMFGWAYLAATRLAEAEQSYREAQHLAPDSAAPARWLARVSVTHKRLGDMLQGRGDRYAARAEYEAALRIDPANVEAQTALRALRP